MFCQCASAQMTTTRQKLIPAFQVVTYSKRHITQKRMSGSSTFSQKPERKKKKSEITITVSQFIDAKKEVVVDILKKKLRL
jgi:hypothetical protein